MTASVPPLQLIILIVLRIYISGCEKIDAPTLKPVDPFSASSDAGVFRKEMHDDDITNRDKLVEIWFHRTYDERRQIQELYDRNYCRKTPRGYYIGKYCPFSHALSEISDDTMDDLYEDSLIPPEGILAKVIHESITDEWKEMGAIEEAVCANDKDMKDKIDIYYRAVYNENVANALGTYRKEDNDYQHIMQCYCWKGLCQDKRIKLEDADREAKALRAIDPDADKDGFKKKLIELLDNNCEPDMKMIFEKYRNGDDGIDNAVDKAFTVDRVRRAYNRMVRYVENTCMFYSDELSEAVKGAGTDTDRINRIMLTRAERDLKCIVDTYTDHHKKTFTQRLKWDSVENRWLESIRYLCGKT